MKSEFPKLKRIGKDDAIGGTFAMVFQCQSWAVGVFAEREGGSIIRPLMVFAASSPDFAIVGRLMDIEDFEYYDVRIPNSVLIAPNDEPFFGKPPAFKSLRELKQGTFVLTEHALAYVCGSGMPALSQKRIFSLYEGKLIDIESTTPLPVVTNWQVVQHTDNGTSIIWTSEMC